MSNLPDPDELIPPAFHLLFGAAARRSETAAMYAAVQPSKWAPGSVDSKSLMRWQETEGRLWRSVELVKSIYGWTVRASSGLDGFALMAATKERGGRLDGSFVDAAKWAAEWVALYPERRYAYVRAYDLSQDETATGIVAILSTIADR